MKGLKSVRFMVYTSTMRQRQRQSKTLKISLLGFASLFILGACTDPFSGGSGKSADDVASAQAARSVTYSKVAPILKTYCVTCHAGLANPSVVLSSLAEIDHLACDTRTMPPVGRPQLSPHELELLENWIVAGGPLDATVSATPVPAPEPELPAKWSYISANIINQKCIKCHKADSKHGSLASYNDLFALGSADAADPLNGPKVVRGQPENSPLYEVLEDGAKVAMPPKLTGVTLSRAERDAIHAWILNGAENDLLPQ